MSAQPVSGPLVDYKPTKVFADELFETFVSRIVRKAILLSLHEQEGVPMEEDHFVLVEENRLIMESTELLKKHLSNSIPQWGMALRLAKTIIIHHIRQLARERLEMHECDEELKGAVLDSIFRDDFNEIFSDT